MQTFLPYASFDASARVLDDARLGKQRVETLQILRAVLMPTYGWQRHPAVAMWRGFVPALTAYGLATVRAWTERGHADSVAEQVLEFAPEVEGVPQGALAERGLLPPWLGDPLLHESHRSRLIAKDPAFYRPRFAGTTEGLEYAWPGARAQAGVAAPEPDLWVLRVDDIDPESPAALLGLPAADPRGRVTPAWRDQLRAFEDELVPGVRIGVLAAGQPDRLRLARVTGGVAPGVVDGALCTAVAVRFEGALGRRALPEPAELQNPRRFFRVRSTASLDAPTAALQEDA
ncbi:MSMEG_6728 family protein [Amnibacterium sp.]|uniref:MSMEG_6728 family protein n=1 Tax=Amnibacterium sp. TaxID=1872496 RepID=UPI003F7BE030